MELASRPSPINNVTIKNVKIYKDDTVAECFSVVEGSVKPYHRPSSDSAFVCSVELERSTEIGSHVVLKKSEFTYSNLYSELDFYKMMKDLQGQDVLRAFKAVWTYSDGEEVEGIALELWGDPIPNPKTLSKEEKAAYSKQLKRIYANISKAGVIHGDDENVLGNWLLKNGEIRVIDFGHACTPVEMGDIPAVRINAHSLLSMMEESGLITEIPNLEETDYCEKWLSGEAMSEYIAL